MGTPDRVVFQCCVQGLAVLPIDRLMVVGQGKASRFGLRTRVAAAGLALCALVGGIFALLFFSIQDLRHDGDRARHSERVLAAANRLERLVLDLETGQRGYVISRQSQFLEPWRVARVAAPRQADALAALVRDNPV